MIDRRAMLGAGVGTAGLATIAPAAMPSDPWRRADAIARGIHRPQITPQDQRITDFGARSGVDRDARPAILAAMAALGARGGRVVLPPGVWRCDGPIHLRSGVALHVEGGATLRFSRDAAHYLPPVLTRWEGTECWNYSPLIYARGASDIAITGDGTIDGQGFEGFFRWRAQQKPDQERLRDMGARGVPVAQRRFGEGHYLRPGFVQFMACRRVLIDGPRFVDSTFWMIHPVYCDHVTVRNVTLVSRHLNSDGVDPDSSTNVLIERCIFDVGDDGVAIKSGRDADGWRVGRAASRIVIRDCEYRGDAGGGMSIGSEMSGGVHDVYCERYRMNDVAHGLYFKSNLDRGGAIGNIFIRDVSIATAQAAVIFTTDYHGYRGGTAPTRFADVRIENVQCGSAIVGVSLIGAAAAPIDRVEVRNVTIDRARTPLRVRHARSLRFRDLRINGASVAAVTETGPETFGDVLKF